MNCLECNGKTLVTDSRKKGDIAVMRRRRCTSCGSRQTTVEVTLYDFGRILKKHDVVTKEVVEMIENPELF